MHTNNFQKYEQFFKSPVEYEQSTNDHIPSIRSKKYHKYNYFKPQKQLP